MIVLSAAALAAAWGAFLARGRGGNRLDMAQYAAGFGIAGGIVGLIVTVALSRML